MILPPEAADTFLELTDTDPVNYAGEAGNCVIVNAGEDGLEFGAAPGGAFTSRCSVYRAAAQSINPSTDVKIGFDTEDWDNDDEFDSVTNYRFVAKEEGYYHISTQVCMQSIAAGKTIIAKLRKNGVDIAIHREYGLTAYICLPISKDVYLNGSTDYIEVFVRHDAAAPRPLQIGDLYTYLAIHRFG